MVETSEFAPRLSVDQQVALPIVGQGSLVLGRGTVDCRMEFLEKDRGREEWDVLHCALDIAAEDGRVFRLRRELPANLLFDLVRVGRTVAEEQLKSRPLVRDVRCYLDDRIHIPTIVRGREGFEAAAFWAKSLSAVIELLAAPSLSGGEELVVKVDPVAAGFIGGKDAPAIVVTTTWAPKLVLFPNWLSDRGYEDLGVGLLERTDRKSVANPNVREL